jgi:phosphoesterase RecJ-like protein
MSLSYDPKVAISKEITKEEAIEFLKSHNRFLLIGHEHPDGDDVGSICALHNALRLMGKEADMVLPDPVPHVYTLVKTTEKVLTEIPEGKDYDALVFTDLGNLERGGRDKFKFPNVDSLCIDHHESNEHYTDYLYLKYRYAATAELLSEMFFDMGLTLDEDTCNALYMALCTDSGFFSFSCTSEHTLMMAAKLVGMGAKPDYISNHLDEKTEDAIKCWGRVSSTLQSFENGQIVTAIMDEEAMRLDGENSDAYASIPRSLKGCQIAALLKYRTDKDGNVITRISLRSTEHCNVGKLAAEFDGGGHWKASGCSINKPIEEALPILVGVAKKYLPGGEEYPR